MNNVANVKHEGWELVVNWESILISKDSEYRTYDLNDIQDTLHEDEYVTLKKDDGGYYLVKFEEDNFLVIDEYDEEGEFVDSIGSHVFGEHNCDECGYYLGESYENCGASEDGVCPECGTEK